MRLLILGLCGWMAGPPALAGGPDRDGPTIRLETPSTRETRQEALELLAQQANLEAIERLKEMTTRPHLHAEIRAEMLLRLGSLYAQEGRRRFFRELELHDAAMLACMDHSTCEPSRLKPDHTTSMKWRQDAARVYTTLLSKFATYARADQAALSLATLYLDLERPYDAATALKGLLHRSPESPLVPDALVLLGDHYFDVRADPSAALRVYRRAAAHRDSPLHAYAVYRLAWCWFNVGEYDAAIGAMKAVALGEREAEEDHGLGLRDEALRDLVRFYADADRPEEAEEVFSRLGREDLVRSMMQRLAGSWMERGQHERGIHTLRRLILRDAAHLDAPGHQLEIVRANGRMGRRTDAMTEIHRFHSDYGPESAWAHAHDVDVVQQAHTSVEEPLRKLALNVHETGRRYEHARRPDDAVGQYALARDAYETWLEWFAEHEHTYDMTYAYAELLWAVKDHGAAYDAYMAVVRLDPAGKHSQFCAESAVFAAEAQIELDTEPVGPLTAHTQAVPLSTWEQRYVDACEQYVELYDDPKTKDMLYRSAYLLYSRYHFEEAAQRFRTVIALDPRSREAEYAAQLILDALAVRQSWSALQQTARAFHEASGLGGAAFKRDVLQIQQRAAFKVVEVGFAADADHGKAGRGYRAFFDAHPMAETAAQALNNAAFHFGKAGRFADATDARQILVEDARFGARTPYYFEQLAALGFDHERIADYDRAAALYERLWEHAPADGEHADQAADAIFSAAVFREGLGQPEAAITNYTALVARRSTDPRAPDIALRIARLHGELGRWNEAAAAYRAYAASPPAGADARSVWAARLRHGQALAELGDTDARDAAYDDAIARYRREVATGSTLGVEIGFVAEMMLVRTLTELDTYLPLRIDGPARTVSRDREDKVLTEALTAKAVSLRRLERRFTDIVELRAGEAGMTSLVALGRAYENMAETVRTSHVPTYLTPEQRDLYLLRLEDQAYVQEQKAVHAYEHALEQAYSLMIYDEHAAVAVRRLGELRPDDHPALDEWLLEPRWTASDPVVRQSYERAL